MYARRSKPRLALLDNRNGVTSNNSPGARTSPSMSSNTPSSLLFGTHQQLPDHSMSPASTSRPLRCKDVREQALARSLEATLQATRNLHEQQRSFAYHTRWLHLRAFYALTCETIATISKKPPASPPTRGSMVADTRTTHSPAHSFHLAASSLTARASSSVRQLQQPTATTTTSALWLCDIANALERACPSPNITLLQLESAITTALHVNVFTAPAFVAPAARLRASFQAFEHSDTRCIDYRELLCALYMLDRWRLSDTKLLQLWFHTFATVMGSSGSANTLVVSTQDLPRLLGTACEGPADEQQVAPFIQTLQASANCSYDNGSYITQHAFGEFVAATPALRNVIKTQCWRRLTDDTRLAFYRDLALHASDAFAHEQLRVRMAIAMQHWRFHEPRRRLERWRSFVADRKLLQRGDAQYRSMRAKRFVKAFQQHHARQQRKRQHDIVAYRHHQSSLLQWALKCWRVALHTASSVCEIEQQVDEAQRPSH